MLILSHSQTQMILYWQDFFSLILDTLNPSLPSFFQVPFPINQSPTESTEPSQAHSGKTVLREISPSSAPSINSRYSQSKGIPHHITCPCQAERTLPTEKAKPWQFYLPGGIPTPSRICREFTSQAVHILKLLKSCSTETSKDSWQRGPPTKSQHFILEVIRT